MDRVQATSRVGKRKATDGQDNERLAKRLSLLNLGVYSFVATSLPTSTSDG
jgi:hypothetical protein